MAVDLKNLCAIFKTPEVDLKSDIGMQLKREMLVTLAKKDTSLYPNDKQKQTSVYNRYSSYALPVRTSSFLPGQSSAISLIFLKKLEEAEWVGLKPWEAMTKQKEIEAKNHQEAVRPLKEVFREELFKKLESGEEPADISVAASTE